MSKRQNVRVIPVLLQEVDWTYSIFGGLAPLPDNGRPVASWKDRNAAFLNVVKGIRQIVTNLAASAGSDVVSSSALTNNASHEDPPAPAPKSPTNLTPFRR